MLSSDEQGTLLQHVRRPTVKRKIWKFTGLKKKIYQGLWIWVVLESLTTLKTRKQWSTTVQHSEGSFQPRVLYQTKPWIVCKDRLKTFHHKQVLKNTPYAPPSFRKLNKVSASPKWENKQSEGPRVQEWRDPTQKHEAGLESKRVQGSEAKGLQGNNKDTTTGMYRFSVNWLGGR